MNCFRTLDLTEEFGMIGGRNHFVELSKVCRVQNKALFQRYNLSSDRLYLIIHSGSNRFGFSVQNQYQHSDALIPGTDEFLDWHKKHENLCSWAKRSRAELGNRLCKVLEMNCTLLLDHVHTTITEEVCRIQISCSDREEISGKYQLAEGGFTKIIEERKIFLSIQEENYVEGMEIKCDGEIFIMQRYINKTKRWRLMNSKSGKVIKRKLPKGRRFWTIAMQRDDNQSEVLFRSSGADVTNATWSEVNTDKEIHLKAEEIRLWVHRKSAVRTSDLSPSLILGSRGHYSFIVQPLPGCANSVHSLPAGSGRRFSRAQALQRGRKKWSRPQHKDSVDPHVCDMDEDEYHCTSPLAFKRIQDVIGDLEKSNMVQVIAVLEPILNKT